MPSRPQLLARLRGTYRYEDVAEEFGIAPGLAYMIVTGLPADGSDVLAPKEMEGRQGVIDGPTQPLVNPRTDMPEHKAVVAEWMRGRAAADTSMRQAAEERTATPPPIEAEHETDDVVSLIGWQHNQVKYLQEQLETIPGVRKGGDESKQQQRVSLVDMIRVRLSKHETAEEEHFWPAVRRHLDDGDELANRALGQEQEGKEILQALMGVPGGEDRFDELVEELVSALRKHVAHEDYVLLRFEQAVPADARAEIGRDFRTAHGHAPTRPHPHAPNEGAPLKAAARLAAPLDHIRDAAGSRPVARQGQAEEKPANKATPTTKRSRTRKGTE